MKWLYLALIVCGCKKSEPTAPERPAPTEKPAPTAKPATPPPPRPALPDGPAITATIGAAGGKLASSDGLLAIAVPAGALAADTKLGVQEISAPSASGRGYRIEPSGTAFAKPIDLAFSPEPGESLDGSVATFRDAKGAWVAPAQTHAAGAIHVATTHFSDWSISSGILLTPDHASASKSGNVTLQVQICYSTAPTGTDEPILVDCQAPHGVANMLRSSRLAVNGIANGDATVGTISVIGETSLGYSAPAQVPAANPVAITVEFTTLPNERFGRVIGVASVYIADEPSYFGSFSSVTKHAEGESRGHGAAIWNYDTSDRRWHATGYEHVDAVLGCPVATGGAQQIDPKHSSLEIRDGKYFAQIGGTAVTMVPCQDTAVEGLIDGNGGVQTGESRESLSQSIVESNLKGTFKTSDPDFPTTYTWRFWKL